MKAAQKFKIIVFFILLSCFGCGNSLSDKENDNPEYLPVSDGEVELAIAYIDSLEKLYPTDESLVSPNFVMFKDSLFDAILNRDESFILSILDSNILNSFGGDGGIDEFKGKWKIDDDNSRFWDIFKTSMELGGTFSDDTLTFIFPYLVEKFPNTYDPFFYGALIKEEANIYRFPNEDSKFHTTSYTIFEKLQWSDTTYQKNENYIPIIVNKKRYGFVRKNDFRSATDYRGRFVYTSNSWKLKSFVAGD